MSPWFHQLDLIAQGDGPDWMNLLFIIVVAVFWAVGGIVKAAGSKGKAKQQQGGKGPQKKQQQPRKQTLLQQLTEKAEEFQRIVEGEQQKRSQPARPARKQVPASPPQDRGQIAVRTGRGGQSILVYERKPSQTSAAAPRQPQQSQPTPPPRQQRPPHRPRPTAGRRAPTRTDFAEPTSASEQMTRPVPPRATGTAPSVSVASTVIDPSDPESLRRAILHYEILGKPLALRDPFERNAYS